MEAVERWRARGERVDIQGHGVFVVDEGPREAPVLLLLHGYPSSSADWEHALPHLTASYRVICHDHLGFGLSDKPDDYSYSLFEQADIAVGLWTALGVTGGHVVAHDYGTSVATELAARANRGLLPIHLRGLTLSNGSMLLDLARPRLIQQLLRRRRLGPVVARLASRWMLARNVQAIVRVPLADEELDRMWTLLERDGGRARVPQITRYLDEREQFRGRWLGALESFDGPLHLLWGRHDPVARPAVAEGILATRPDARLTWLELGHWPMLEDPRQWAEGLVAGL